MLHTTDNTVYATTKPGSRRPAEGSGCCGICYTLQTIRCMLQQNQGQDVLLKEVVVAVHVTHYRQRMIVCLPLPVTHHSWVNQVSAPSCHPSLMGKSVQYHTPPPPPSAPISAPPLPPHPAVPLSHTIHHHYHPSGSTIWLLPNIYIHGFDL